MQRSFEVDSETTFPFGVAMIGEVRQVLDFDRSTKERPVQAADDNGLLMWQVEVLDLDPDARQRTLKVKIAAPMQPVPPAAPEGMSFRPVVFEKLTVTPYVDTNGQRPRQAFSLKATGMRAPGARQAAPKAA